MRQPHWIFRKGLSTTKNITNNIARPDPNIREQNSQLLDTTPTRNAQMSRRLPPAFLLPSRRFFTQSCRRTAFATGPSPPRLPPKEQEEFERLQRSSTGAFSTPKTVERKDSSPAGQSRPRPQINQSLASKPTSEEAQINARVEASGKGEELHPDIRRGAKPEFDGERNPKTGEVGGPKNEPLRWGSTADRGDWSYNGRVTDF
ncbi:hypothetical protein BJ875DRAFT_469950 [Amylocarpus encephaloides]|uniref:Succinate dehydrogenase assembly factor 4, mitochondrial n=1 Tax=Amylocarpus encephaloides TaxID=45428 RepID=A0A9P8C2R6_9HELO|nr:hypothetical protein BJ875DRAFT_469950 [Amylocarpus encephaloides]